MHDVLHVDCIHARICISEYGVFWAVHFEYVLHGAPIVKFKVKQNIY